MGQLILSHGKDQLVIVGAAGAGASAQAPVLIVGDDLEVGPVDPALALAGAETGEVVALDQLTVECVVEELADGLGWQHRRRLLDGIGSQL